MLRCAGDHRTTECNREINKDLKCINCKGNHVSSWRGCPLNPKNLQIEKQKAILENSAKLPTRFVTSKSYAEIAGTRTEVINQQSAVTTELRRATASAKVLVSQLTTLMDWIQKQK